MILFTTMKLEASEKMVKRLNKELNKQKIHDISIDFSYGFSEFDPSQAAPPDKLIASADQNMYGVKQAKKSAAKITR